MCTKKTESNRAGECVMGRDKLLSKEQCTGCAACVNICREDAIQMVIDRKGFGYPHIDKEKCSECGACKSVCRTCNSMTADIANNPSVYAMQSRNEKIRRHSTSGGIFSELANVVLKWGGGVCGAVYRNDWSVGHSIIWNQDELEKVRRSKYQQSNIGLVYREIKKMLDERMEILFCGTPCQIAGLKGYLKKEYENLFNCDFICRGVSSPRIFSAYLEELKDLYGSEIESVWMKNKCNGWHSLTTMIGFENGETYIKAGLEDSYIQLFLKYNTGVRESCYKCSFKNNKSVADITLGDFWGLEGTEMDDNLGTSAVICRTLKGAKLIEEIRENVFCWDMQMEDVVKGNPCLCNSIDKSTVDMEKFFDVLEREGYQQALRWIEDNGNR